MNRTEFEAIRDLKGKRIDGDIRFSGPRSTLPILIADGIHIANTAGVELKMNLSYNTQTGSKSVNVQIAGQGPICRLDVDGPNHGEAGRSHKHALQDEHCPRQNLRKRVASREDLAGAPFRSVFAEFCRMANIAHEGLFIAPDEAEYRA